MVSVEPSVVPSLAGLCHLACEHHFPGSGIGVLNLRPALGPSTNLPTVDNSEALRRHLFGLTRLRRICFL